MNREDIIRMAREAGFNPVSYMGANFEPFKRFAALVAAAEREACAELVVRGTDEPVQTKTLEILRKERERIATAIRVRSEQCG
jgi:hypothetical protein